MIQIEDTIVSFDIFVKKFCCDLAQCRGICCVEGDSGAPLEEDEPVRIETNYENIRAYMKPEGIAAVEEQGFSVIDQEGDLVKAWSEGKCDFRKPISCHLYPIRVTKYEGFEALNYNRWDICGCARLKGEQAGMPLYRFLKQALIARYGEEWYEQLEYAAREIEAGNIEIPPR